METQVYGYMDQHTHELTLMGTQKAMCVPASIPETMLSLPPGSLQEWLHQPPLVSLELAT